MFKATEMFWPAAIKPYRSHKIVCCWRHLQNALYGLRGTSAQNRSPYGQRDIQMKIKIFPLHHSNYIILYLASHRLPKLD